MTTLVAGVIVSGPAAATPPTPSATAAAPAATVKPAATPVGSAVGISPTQLRTVYGVDGRTAPAGTTVGIAVANDAPDVESELAAYRSHWALPACTSANGCFHKVDQRGVTVPAGKTPDSVVAPTVGPEAQQFAAAEYTQAVSAMCPSCGIVLVEGDLTNADSVGAATLEAQTLGATVVSSPYSYRLLAQDVYDSYWAKLTVPVFVTSGNAGWESPSTPGTVTPWSGYPAGFPTVVAVGGTSATVSGNSLVDEAAWSGAGSGCSSFAASSAQNAYFAAIGSSPGMSADCGTGADATRAISDVSALADPDRPGFAVYRSGTWTTIGGTGLATQYVAALAAYAGPRPAGSSVADVAYGLAAAGAPDSLVDVTSGSNNPAGTTCGGARICTAQAGWDGPTGLGTPRGTGLFAPLLTAGVTTAIPGRAVPLSGSDFIPGETVTVTAGSVTTSATATATGTWSTTVTVPSGTQATFPVTVTGARSGFTASLVLHVPVGQLSVPTTAWAPGRAFTATASDFWPGESVTFHVDSGATDVVRTADQSGSVTADFVVPVVTQATAVVVTATGASSGLARTATLSVPTATVTLPASAPAGTTLALSGSSFATGETVRIAVSPSSGQLTAPPSVTAAADGTFSTAVTVAAGACALASTVTLTGASSHRTVSATTTTPPGATLSSGCAIGAGSVMSSPSGQYLLAAQSDGNLVLYFGGRPLWNTATSGASTRLVLQSDGNLVLYAATRALWSSGTSGTGAGGRLRLQDDGNLVLYDAAGRPRWYTGSAGTDRLQRGDFLQSDWNVHSRSGVYRLVMQTDGNLVEYTASGAAVWSTRTSYGTPNGEVYHARMRADGIFVITEIIGGGPEQTTWTDAAGYGTFLVVQDDGNVVIYDAAGRPVWATRQ